MSREKSVRRAFEPLQTSTQRLATLGSMILVGLVLVACQADQSSMKNNEKEEMATMKEWPNPPMAEQRDHMVEAPAGNRNDPWYWLRDDDREDKDMIAYLEAENEYKEAALAHLADLRSSLFEELKGRIKEDDSTVPYLDRGYWYYTRYEEGLEYPIFARKSQSLDAPEEIVLDVNEVAQGHEFYSVGDMDITLDGRKLAWLEDTVGRRQYEIVLKDLDNGEVSASGISGVSSVTWSADNQYLFYVANHPETLRSWQVWRLDLSAASDDPDRTVLVYQEDDESFYTGIGRTTSDDFITLYVSSTVSTEMQVLPSNQPLADFTVFFPRERDHEYGADHLGDHWIIRTNYQAPNFRIMKVSLADHANREAWEDVIAHHNDRFIHGFDAFDTFLAISERSNGLRALRIYDWDTQESSLMQFDEAAYAAYLSTNVDQSSTVLRYVYTSMTTPTQTWEMNIESGERTLLKQVEVPGGFDASDYVTDRTWAQAQDGTMIPVSLMYHKNTDLDGTAPLYQYGYGSYGASMDPTFSTSRLSLVDRGFVYAIAHIRGGQEMGREWYEQGRLLNKVNTFTDFIDVTNHLIEQDWVDPSNVFAMGGSAGGLLVGAVVNMAPDKYQGVIAHVPFVDVVTTMLDESIPLTTNEFDEWGNPKDPVYYEYMLSYSPYDNVEPKDYPAMLVTSGLWDSQVQYWEPTKWVAKLRATKTDDNLLLLHTNMEAGHGGASGRFKRLEQTAMEYAFVLELAQKASP